MLSTVTGKTCLMLRMVVPYLDRDESLSDHIGAAAQQLQENKLLAALPDGDLHCDT